MLTTKRTTALATVAAAALVSSASALAAGDRAARDGQESAVIAVPEDSVAVRPEASKLMRVTDVLNRWQPVVELLGLDAAAWREQMMIHLAAMPVDSLRDIQRIPVGTGSGLRRSYERFVSAFKSELTKRYSKLAKGTGKALGSATDNQVFFPVAPCRVVDTRPAFGGIGALPAGVKQSFYLWESSPAWSWATQGGQSGVAVSACPGTIKVSAGGMLPDVTPSAAVATITVVAPTAAGNFLIWGGNGPAPTVSALNWSTGQTLANTTVIPIGARGGDNKDFAVIYNGPTGSGDFIVDVVGYFVESTATALDCIGDAMHGTGTDNWTTGTALPVDQPACITGYTSTGGGFHYDGASRANIFTLQESSATFGNCVFFNNTGVTLNQSDAACEVVCCRVPGQ